jgi:hypothetical protein
VDETGVLSENRVGKKAGNTHISQDAGNTGIYRKILGNKIDS